MTPLQLRVDDVSEIRRQVKSQNAHWGDIKVKEMSKMYDSQRNWSIMLSQDLNSMRNEAMQRIKTNQIRLRQHTRTKSQLANGIRPQTKAFELDQV